MGVDAGLMVGAVDAWNTIERVVLRHRRADKTALEYVGTPDRGAVGLRRGIRLAPAERLGRIEKIGIARDAVIAGLASMRVGVDGEITTPCIHQDAAFDPAIDR